MKFSTFKRNLKKVADKAQRVQTQNYTLSNDIRNLQEAFDAVISNYTSLPLVPELKAELSRIRTMQSSSIEQNPQWNLILLCRLMGVDD